MCKDLSGRNFHCPAHPMTSPQWGSASGPRAQLEGTLRGDPQEGLLPTGGHLPVATAWGYNRWACNPVSLKVTRIVVRLAFHAAEKP